MHFVPNGQNIQFINPDRLRLDGQQPKAEEALVAMEPPKGPKIQKVSSLTAIPKDAAPHMNRHQRRAHLAAIKAQAKERAADAAKKQIALEKKLNKENVDG